MLVDLIELSGNRLFCYLFGHHTMVRLAQRIVGAKGSMVHSTKSLQSELLPSSATAASSVCMKEMCPLSYVLGRKYCSAIV